MGGNGRKGGGRQERKEGDKMDVQEGEAGMKDDGRHIP